MTYKFYINIVKNYLIKYIYIYICNIIYNRASLFLFLEARSEIGPTFYLQAIANNLFTG